MGEAVSLTATDLTQGASDMFRMRRAFTLTELALVSGLVAAMLGALLPAILTVRESSRQMDCATHMRQMGRAIVDMEHSYRHYPTGGVEPWPTVEEYSRFGKPLEPERQGLGWAFQILPFLGYQEIYLLGTTQLVARTSIPTYFCPTRRPPTASMFQGDSYFLIDYSSLSAAKSRSQLGNGVFNALLTNGRGCGTGYSFWGITVYGNDFNPLPRGVWSTRYTGFQGVVVRGSYLARGTTGEFDFLDYDPPTTVRRITDGIGKTIMLVEKRLVPPYVPGFYANDDRGWSDGYDIDTVKLSLCQPRVDGADLFNGSTTVLTPGSAHAEGMNVAFADGRVGFLRYGIDVETFNQLGNRGDGEVIDWGRADGLGAVVGGDTNLGGGLDPHTDQPGSNGGDG